MGRHFCRHKQGVVEKNSEAAHLRPTIETPSKLNELNPSCEDQPRRVVWETPQRETQAEAPEWAQTPATEPFAASPSDLGLPALESCTNCRSCNANHRTNLIACHLP
eukprot:5794172-Amphidinium_carterae.1